MAALVDGIPATCPLTAVVHTAGAPDGSALAQQTVTRFQEVLRAKAEAARHLHDLTRERTELTSFVLFSSFAAVAGAAGQADQAVADALLDALAEERRAAGLPVTCVTWGPWAEATAGDGAVGDRGLIPMRPDLALRALDRAVLAEEARVAVFDADWEHVAATPGARPLARLFDGVPAMRQAAGGVRTVRDGLHAQDPEEFGRRLAALSENERGAELLRLVRTHAALVLGHDTDDVVAPERSFVEMGFDSLTATRLRNRLGAATGLQISAATVFDCPTPDTLAGHLLSLYAAPRVRQRPRLRPRNRG